MKKHKPIIFVQTIHPYRHDLCVCVGATFKEFIKTIDPTAKDMIKYLTENKVLFDNLISNKYSGYALKSPKDELIIILPRCNNDWAYWESLIHEISHVLDWVVELKLLQGETEARAYLHEWLFRVIRRRIQGVDK